MKKIILMLLVFFSALFSMKIIAKNSIIYTGNPNNKNIYLTFDDGYTVKNTNKILDVLKEEDICATFFLEGDFIKYNAELAKRIQNEQTLANHTYSHRDITKMSDYEFRKEIERFEALCINKLGKKNTKYFRPPMGFINNAKLKILEEYGYKTFMWNVCCYDYDRKKDRGVEYVKREIYKQTKNGSIILMHTLTDSNAKALRDIIRHLKEKGYIFSSLGDLV